MTDKLISQKAVLDHLNDICNRCGRFNRNNGAECGYCELCGMDEFVEELPTISADGDLISRKSVIQLTREMISAEEYGLMDLLDEVKKLPTIPQTDSVLNEIKTELHEELYGDISYTDLERIEHIIDNHIRGKE